MRAPAWHNVPAPPFGDRATLGGLSVALSQLVAAFDFSNGLNHLAGLASLLMLPFAHEDLAVFAGAYLTVNKLMPTGLVVLCIYGGMVASDFALYGVGAGARHLPWLDRLFVGERVRRFGPNLQRDLLGLFLLCRIVPGSMFVGFVACGWSRVRLTRFTAASLLVSALYLPIVFYLAIVFGSALDARVGLWSWPMLFAVIIAAGLVRRRVFAFGAVSEWGELVPESPERAAPPPR